MIYQSGDDIQQSYQRKGFYLHHSARLISEQQSLPHSKFKVICGNFFTLWLLKHCKNLHCLQTVTFLEGKKLSRTFLEGEITKMCNKKQKVGYSVALVMAFLVAEIEN